MRSLVTVPLLVLFALGCDAAEPASDDPAPAPTPSPTAPAPSEGAPLAPATPTPEAPVIAAPVVPTPPPAPTPVDVCRHVREVGGKDQPASNLLDEVERDCVVALERVRKQYDTLTSCLLNTNTAADVAACEHGMRDWTDLLSKANPKPTSSQVCGHLMDIMKREFGDSGTVPSDEDMAKFQDECAKDLEKQQEKIGAEKFEVQVACVMAATKMEDLAKCDKDEGLPNKEGPLTTGSDVCDHVLAVMTRELGDVTPSDDDMTKYREQCIKDLAKEQAKLSSEQFQAQSACILAASTLESMAACDRGE
jgi:hypothetical protein